MTTDTRTLPATSVAPADGVRLQVLGPLRLWRADHELDPGPPLQALLLGVLLARAHEPVGASELVGALWDADAPPSALNSVHKYVGALRRLFEPGLGPRQQGSLLHRHGSGYLCTAGAGALDVVAFREGVGDARVALARQQYERAMRDYERALALWCGPVGAGLPHRLAARSVFSALDAEFLDACTAAAALAAQLGRHERVLAPLTLAASIDPLHEPVLAALVTALGATGRQAAASSVFHDARARLADELGIDAGPALEDAHRRVLGQQEASTAVPRADQAAAGLVPGIVGRADELHLVASALEAAASGASAVVVVEGEPGIGKTRLLEETEALAARHDAVVAWGRCRDRDGTPSLWPWVEIIRTLLDSFPPAERSRRLASELGQLTDPADRTLVSPVLPDTGARFRLFEQVVSLLSEVATARPVLLLLDDLQWADAATLALFEHVAARAPGGCVLLGALRDRAPSPSPDLVHALAAVGRLRAHRRVRLGALPLDDVAELVRREGGIRIPSEALLSIHARTAGNPFFVRELARLLAHEPAATQHADIPRTVVDIVRDRVQGLDADAGRLLQVAAVIGSRVELDVLARALGVERASLPARSEALEALGLVATDPDAPHVLTFAHDLVREAIVASTPRTSLAAVHLRVADAMERAKEADDIAAERFAHHLWEAGPLAEPGRTADALICAGRAAAAKSAFGAAEERLGSASSLARTAQLPHLELEALTQLIAVVGVRTGYVGSAVEALERAEELARRLGRDREAADLLFSRWAGYSQAIRLERAERLARRLLREGMASKDPLVRAYGVNAWGIHQWDVGNIGEAYDYLRQAETIIVSGGKETDFGRLRRDLQLLWPVMRALMTALHGDLEAAYSLLGVLEVEAEDDPYAITVWAAFSVVIAAVAGDPVFAERAAGRGIAVDPEWSFAFLGAYQRLALCWARGVTGDDPDAAAAEAERIIEAVLTEPARSGVATWYGLLAEILLAAGRPAEASVALDRADAFVASHGQRYAEGLLLTLRARVMRADGSDAASVRAVAERARALSLDRGAGLFANRAARLLAELDATT